MITTTLKLGSHLSGFISLCLLSLLFSLKVPYLQNALVLQNRKADELSILCMENCVSIILMIVLFFFVFVHFCFRFFLIFRKCSLGTFFFHYLFFLYLYYLLSYLSSFNSLSTISYLAFYFFSFHLSITSYIVSYL